MGHIGTVIFALQAVMLMPYIIIGVMGGGETLEGVSKGAVPYWIGGLVVACVVMSYVFFGGMRGTAWVNTLQTLMFLVFGTIAFVIIARGIGGFGNTVQQMADTLKAGGSGVGVRVSGVGSEAGTAAPSPEPRNPKPETRSATPAPPPDGALLIRGKVNPNDPKAIDRVAKGYWFSYSFIPLSSIMFPHIAIFCLTAQRMSSFRKTVIFYPLCIMAIWLPAVFLGTVASSQPDLVAHMAVKSEGFAAFQQKNPAGAALMEDVAAGRVALDDPRGSALKAGPLKGEMRRLANANSDGVMLEMLNRYAPAVLAGILGAAIMACVMATDSQILALSTMWATDVYHFYGGRSEVRQVWSARVFVIVCTLASYAIALAVHEYANIFELAIQYAFSGYASMAPIMLACLFWRRSTKWGALASTLWVALMLAFITWLQWRTTGIAPANPSLPPVRVPGWELFGEPLFFREYNRVSFTSARFLMVFPMFVGAALSMWLGSILTPPPTRETVEKYFPAGERTPSEELAVAGG
jgi:SSS family solute:Na+ symporter